MAHLHRSFEGRKGSAAWVKLPSPNFVYGASALQIFATGSKVVEETRETRDGGEKEPPEVKQEQRNISTS
jgi:hypothetical protein